jgi:hypothetical protein
MKSKYMKMYCKVQGHWYIINEEGRMDSMFKTSINSHSNPQHVYHYYN